MIQESFAILAVFVLLFISFARSKYSAYTPTAVPMIVTPVVYILARGFLYATKGGIFGFRYEVVLAFACVIGLALTVLVAAIISVRFNAKKNRVMYLGLILLYSSILSWAYIYQSLLPILH